MGTLRLMPNGPHLPGRFPVLPGFGAGKNLFCRIAPAKTIIAGGGLRINGVNPYDFFKTENESAQGKTSGLMPDKANGFGNFHHRHGNQNQSQPQQIQLSREKHQTESGAQGREQNQGHQGGGQEGRPVQTGICEGADGKEGVLRAHIEGLHDLREGENQKAQRLSTGSRAALPFSQPIGQQGQQTEHDALAR